MAEELLKQMAQAVIDGDEERAVVLARPALDQGIEPLATINKGFAPGFAGDAASAVVVAKRLVGV